VPDAIGEGGEGKDCAGAADSDVEEGNFGEIGTVRAWTVFSATSAASLEGNVYCSSDEIRSGGGIGIPRAAAMS
jgi:hypothetical protein